MGSYSNSKGVLLVEVTEVLFKTGITFGPRGAINQVASDIVDRLFQSENWEVIQEYLQEQVDSQLPDA